MLHDRLRRDPAGKTIGQEPRVNCLKKISKNVVVYNCKCWNPTERYILAMNSSVDIEQWQVTQQGRVFRKNKMLIPSFFLNNFEEITNTSFN